ncbi:T9SS type A sorting domain-containing protein [Hymenobacter arizonensis]|uniref:Por secretion system C-terminal sorting domain-containing protein n=1 Tax=Hymenobacter arizonensis TaxID=1227077 RepID=A0A1I5ZC04_HYMAR|nr:T9SS type A sorting domain-containing protein [Hymenobacter arizonensis]SFQ53999.1 Por secretion system C-terminal sorting domain-containing protein [Hymenobacter arizonensis]
MMTPFRLYCYLMAALLLAGGAASAQVALPLAADPARAAYAPTKAALQLARRGTAAVTLPFFDDFTTPLEGAPKAQNWLPSGGALVSNRLAVAPLTRGAATLDGLRANGRSYSGLITGSYGNIDSLTSQPIDLGGLSVNDQVYLSFAWQAGSIVGAPNSDINNNRVRLELFAKTVTGTWELVWFYRSTGQRTAFRQQVVDLNQARFLHSNFQFQFVASGNRSDNSDAWSVDYVVLDRGRTRGLVDTTFVDIATSAGLRGGIPSGGLRSPLRRYTAMPVWQFNAASPLASELNTRLGVNLSNLNAGLLPIPIDVTGTVRELPSGAALGTWLQISRPLPVNPRQDSVTGAASRVAVPITPAPKTLRYTLALNTQEANPRTLANDTIFRDVELNNYYAYDDGTAENITQLVPYSTGQASAFAYRIDLNQPDFVRALRMYPVFTASDAGSRSVTITVWGNNGGLPAATPLATRTATIPNPLPAGSPYFEITFDQAVPVTGTFFVGYSQPSQGRDLHYGLDLNNTFPEGYLVRRDNTGNWSTVNFFPADPIRRGALMMRPVMSNTVVTSNAASRKAEAYSLYPNPTRGTVNIAGPAFARATVLDAVGRRVWEQPAAQAGRATLALSALPAGVYTVQLTLADGSTVGRRLLLE